MLESKHMVDIPLESHVREMEKFLSLTLTPSLLHPDF